MVAPEDDFKTFPEMFQGLKVFIVGDILFLSLKRSFR